MTPPPPTPTCDEPAPWDIPDPTQVVGDGTAASCTESALREAVASAGRVTFNCGADPVTIPIASVIEVGQPTVVDGEQGSITLDGGGTSQILSVATNASLSVRNLRFINGRAPDSTDADGIGGAIAGQWRSQVEVRNCIFEDNTAGRGGGAVSVWTGSSLTIVGSQFFRNRSFYGGAVYSLLSGLSIVNSEFLDNATLTESDMREGGAIGTDGASESPDDEEGGTVEICGTRILGSQGYHSGGGAYIWVYPPDRVVIDQTLVEGNAVGDGGLGGGMRVSNGEIIITASSFISNTTDRSGGALYLDCAPTCTITNSTFDGNEAADYGGAIFGDGSHVNNVTFARNYAGGHGGALFGENFVLRNSIFLDNTAGNPWYQAYSCSSTGTGDHVLQWQSDSGDGGADLCIPDVVATDPLLASEPADNGGATPTLLPAAESPVLQAGVDCEPFDQRGETRVASACDLGAVELP